MGANESDAVSGHQFSARCRDVLMNVQCSHKWWFTLKVAVFGFASSHSLLTGEGDGLVCELVGKVNLMADPFDSKKSRNPVDLPSSCHPTQSLMHLLVRLGGSC